MLDFVLVQTVLEKWLAFSITPLVEEWRNVTYSRKRLSLGVFFGQTYNWTLTHFLRNRSKTCCKACFKGGTPELAAYISCCADKLFGHIRGMNKIAWKYNFAQKCSLDRLEALKQAMLSA